MILRKHDTSLSFQGLFSNPISIETSHDQPGFFDPQNRLHQIERNGDSPAKINVTVNGELFRPTLEKAGDKNCQSIAGRSGAMSSRCSKIWFFTRIGARLPRQLTDIIPDINQLRSAKHSVYFLGIQLV
jgi:hypothetical protein